MFCMMDIILWWYCIPRFEQHPKWNENSVIISTKTFFYSTTFRTNLIFVAPLMLYYAVGNEHCTVAPSLSKNIMSCPFSISHCCPKHPHLIFQSSIYPPSIIRYWIPSFLELAFSLSLLSKESPVHYKKVLSLLLGERKSVFFSFCFCLGPCCSALSPPPSPRPHSLPPSFPSSLPSSALLALLSFQPPPPQLLHPSVFPLENRGHCTNDYSDPGRHGNAAM